MSEHASCTSKNKGQNHPPDATRAHVNYTGANWLGKVAVGADLVTALAPRDCVYCVYISIVAIVAFGGMKRLSFYL